MGFEKVYESLQQLFPQVDARALKAVSIEHSKDVDTAVLAVLEEIIPFFTERSAPRSPPSLTVSVSESSEGNSSMRTEALTHMQNDDSVVCGKPSDPFYDTYDWHHEGEENTAELTLSVGDVEDRIKMKASVHSQGESRVVIDENRVKTHQIEFSAGPQTEGRVSEDKYPESSINIPCGSIPQPRVGMLQDLDMGVCQKIDCTQENEEISEGPVQEITVHNSGSIVQQVETSDVHESNLDKSKLSLSIDMTTSERNISKILGTEEESSLNVTMSSQIHITNVIEEAIADARNNKKTLFLEMESVVNLMKQVEVKELAVEQAKAEAATVGMDLLNKVEELKIMLQHTKEANDMHAGEVYGEKAILATELRELQSRVCSLSDERDVSLAILDEMRQSLEVRLSAAVNEINSAELSKLVKEEAARKSLAEHEFIMEKMMQESKKLRQQAEDNAKLEEFLLDRGRIVDILQGEIAVVGQDVKLLKERFDQHVPLGKSLLSSQTSFMLASSASSLASDQLGTQNNRDHDKVPDDEAVGDDSKALVENDGWEHFDSSEVDA